MAYLDIDPWLLGEGLVLVHEDTFGHGDYNGGEERRIACQRLGKSGQTIFGGLETRDERRRVGYLSLLQDDVLSTGGTIVL